MIIRVNMATSLDGKIAPASREKFRLGTSVDVHRMEELREWADVIVVGAGTLRAEDPPFKLKDREASRRRVSEGRPEHPAVAVISGSLNLAGRRTFDAPGRHLIVTHENSPEPASELSNRAEIWRVGRDRVDVVALVDRFSEVGFERILVEGGGEVAAGFFEHNLVDELFLTLTPWLMGGDDAPGLANADRLFEMPPRFELVSVEETSEEVFLFYRRGIEHQ